MKYVLANDATGNPIDVPEQAVAWRVRRAPRGPGRPQNVYDQENGRQLEIPLDSSIDDLRECGCGPGRYRLDAVDNEAKVIPGLVAFTELASDEPRAESQLPESVARLLETVERQTDTMCRAVEAMVQAFGPLRPAPTITIGDAQPAAPSGGLGIKPEHIGQIMEVARGVMTMLGNRGGIAPGAVGGGAS